MNIKTKSVAGNVIQLNKRKKAKTDVRILVDTDLFSSIGNVRMMWAGDTCLSYLVYCLCNHLSQ